MYIKIATTYYKKKKFEYVRIVKSETSGYAGRVERVIATLGTVQEVLCTMDTLIDGLKKLRKR